MRLLTIFFLFVSTLGISQELKKLRVDYPKANLDKEITNTLYETLSSITKEDNKTIVAYKGAIATLKAKFAKGFRDKKKFFKEGAELLDFAITSEPKNIEIRCLRLGVQENSPKIVGYKKNIEEDKQYLLDHFASVTDVDLQKFIKGYVALSAAFTDAEKQLF